MRHTVLLALLALGCPEPVEEEPPVPSAAFLSPSEGVVLAVGDVAVSLLIEDLTLVEQSAARARPAPFPLSLVPEARAHEGHVAYEGYAVLRLDGADVATLVETTTTVPVEAGSHVLEVELFHVDGAAFDPPVTAEVSFSAQ